MMLPNFEKVTAKKLAKSILPFLLLPFYVYSYTQIDAENGVLTDQSEYKIKDRSWRRGAQVEFWYNPNGQPAFLDTDSVIDIITEAMHAWNEVSNLELVYKGITEKSCINNDNYSIICWASEEELDSFVGNYRGLASYSTHPNYSKLFRSVDIRLNPNDRFNFSNLNDRLLPVVLHEFGHLIGLDHADTSNAVMSISSNFNKLLPDDIAGAEYLYPPFTSEKLSDLEIEDRGFRLCIKKHEYIDYWEEANDVEFLDCGPNQSFGVQSIQGVEKFPNLKSLIISYSSVKKVDLSGNNELLRFEADFTELDELEIGNISKIEYLSVPLSEIKELDISNLKNLKYLDVQKTQIEVLDISSNVELQDLIIYGLPLSELHLENNHELRRLGFNGGKLTSIDLSNNTKLERVFLNGNRLKSLVLGDNVSLQILEARNNKIKSIDVSKSPELKSVDLSGNRLSRFEPGQNELLESLDLSSNRLTIVDIEGLDSLGIIDLGNNGISEMIFPDLPYLYSVTLNSSQLRKLDVSGLNNLVYLDIEDNLLTEIALESNAALKTVKIANNPLTNDAYIYIQNLIENELGANASTYPESPVPIEMARASNFDSDNEELVIPCVNIIFNDSELSSGPSDIQYSAVLSRNGSTFTIKMAKIIRGVSECSAILDISRGTLSDNISVDYDINKRARIYLKLVGETVFMLENWEEF